MPKSFFHDRCADCHGDTGHGDGFIMQQIGGSAADLTAAHIADHTAGDMFWWIGHGTPSEIMPGQAAEISADDRWDLVNYVRLLTLSARANGLTGTVAPGKPWLPAIDFSFTDSEGNAHTLRDFEGTSALLVVLASEPGDPARLASFAAAMAELQAANLTVLFVGDEATAQALPDIKSSPSLFVITRATAETLRMWRYYGTSAAQTEFLVDRFGYVRARWQGGDGHLPPLAGILRETTRLQDEPQILPTPEDHLH